MSTLHALPHVKAKGWPKAKLLIVVVESTVDHVSAAAGGAVMPAVATFALAVAICSVAPYCVVAIVKVLKTTDAELAVYTPVPVASVPHVDVVNVYDDEKVNVFADEIDVSPTSVPHA
jgi:hypothetical protein